MNGAQLGSLAIFAQNEFVMVKMARFSPLAFYVALCLFSLLVNACGRDDTDDELTENTLEAEKKEVYPMEVVAIYADQDFNETSYTALAGDESVEFSVKNGNLYWVVPNWSPGKRTLQITIDNTIEELNFEVLAPKEIDAENYIADYFSEWEAEVLIYEEQVDSMILDSLRGFEALKQDKEVWAAIKNDAEAELKAMTTAQKEQLAQTLAANAGWIANLDAYNLNEFLSFKKASVEDCKNLIKEGRAEQKAGNRFSSASLAIQAYWCAMELQEPDEVESDIDKGMILLDDAEFFSINTLTNLVGRKIDGLTREVQQLSDEEAVAEEVEDADQNKRAALLTFTNGGATSVYANIRFRSMVKDDVNAEGSLGDMASLFNYLIGTHQQMASLAGRELVWRPGFYETSRVIPFNRFLSIEPSSISNDDVVLVNEQIQNDEWKVVFGNDGVEAKPAFKFILVYDDGHVKIGKELSGRVKNVIQYGSVKIGNQVWSTSNLRQTGFRNGSKIKYIATIEEWEAASNSGTPAWAVYGGDTTDLLATGGVIYNYHALLASSGLAPEGWHIPTIEEWEEMSNFLGGWEEAGRKLKATSGWPKAGVNDGNGSNESGFNGLPTRDIFYNHNISEWRWSYNAGASFWAQSTGTEEVYFYTMSSSGDQLLKIETDKPNGFHVRLVKD